MNINIATIKSNDNIMLSRLSTFRVGGIAKKIFEPSNIDEIKAIVDYCKNNDERFFVLGNGSNVLFSDEGFDGCIIHIYNNMNGIDIDGCKIYAYAGATLSKIASLARDNSLTGMEFAAGIPGTVGGAVTMNAGAYGGEMKDIVEYVDILDLKGNLSRYSKEQMDFAYRHSIVTDEMIVVGVGLLLGTGNKSDIENKMQELNIARKTKQPLEYPSAGSTFKRPKGYFAGKLIEDAGLKGYKHGGAMVSDKHCGFVINTGNATSKDILELIDYVVDTVKEKFGVVLETEVKIIK